MSTAVSSGKLDPSYGNGGWAFVPTGQFAIVAMAANADGTAILVGNSLVKLDSSGAKVEGFGYLPDSRRFLNAPVVDESGNIYALFSNGAGAYGVTKLDAAGRTSSDFGSNGVAPLPTPGGLLRDGDGNLYVPFTSLSQDIAVTTITKLDRDGRVDPSFGAAGVATVALPQSVFFFAAALDRDGNLYLSGKSTGFDIVVVKLNRNGTLATDFGGGGIWLRRCGIGAESQAIAIDSDRNVFVGATCSDAGDGYAVVFKLDAHGNPVASFRDGGLRRGLFGGDSGSPPVVTALLPGSGGSIYVGGRKVSNPPTCPGFAVAKLDLNGNPVTTFGDSGTVLLKSAAMNDDLLTDMALDSQGRLYLGGVVSSCGLAHLSVLGYSVYRMGG